MRFKPPQPKIELVRAFDLISRLRARPKYQLSSDTKLPCESALYLALHGWDFCLHQPLMVMRSRGEPESTRVKVVLALML